jgi:hypothetical protein
MESLLLGTLCGAIGGLVVWAYLTFAQRGR